VATVVALAAVLALGACTGGSDDRAAGGGAGGGGAGGTAGSGFSGQGSEEFCRVSTTYQDPAGRLGQASGANLRQLTREAHASVAQMVASAPPEIRPDVEVLAAGLSEFITALEAANFDLTKVPAPVLERFQERRYIEATDRFQAYLREVCGYQQ
jgi:hypothetical protein